MQLGPTAPTGPVQTCHHLLTRWGCHLAHYAGCHQLSSEIEVEENKDKGRECEKEVKDCREMWVEEFELG